MIRNEVFHRSELLFQDLLQIVASPAYDSSSRIAVSGNLCQISIEHSCAFRTLAENRMFTSSFVMLRAQFEAAVRSVWTLYAASKSQVDRMAAPMSVQAEQAARNLPHVQDMLAGLACVPDAKLAFDALFEFKGSAWGALNSINHAGIHPLKRMVDGYPVPLILANVKSSNALAMVAAMQFCILTGSDGLQRQLDPLYERFHDCLPAHRAGA